MAGTGIVASSNIRRTKFTILKDQQRSLNMQIRVAMQSHDTKQQEDLEEKLKEVSEQIDHFISAGNELSDCLQRGF